MSLRSIATLLDGGAGAGKPGGNGRTGLFFVLNRPFLLPFRVLIYSLVKNRSLLDLPVVVISEERAVAEDPVVASLADRFVFAGPEAVAQFSKISREKVEEHLRLPWIAKYTFLKWLIFDDYGFERHVYLDADLLCLNPCDDLAGLAEADLYAGPIFDKRLVWSRLGFPLPVAAREGRMRDFLAREAWRKLNSGVLVLNGKAVDKAFRERLIALAEQDEVPVEQLAVRRLLTADPAYSRTLFSPLYNFNQGFLTYLTAQTQLRLLGQIKLLHFIGSDNKPWDSDFLAGSPREATISEALWNAYAQEARYSHPLFESAWEHNA